MQAPDPRRDGRRRSHPLLDDHAWLHKEYVDHGRSSSDLADELGVTSMTVLNALNAVGVPRRRRGRPAKLGELDPAWLRQQYLERARTASDIARELGVSEDVVLERLHAAGIRLRPRGGTRAKSSAMPSELDDKGWLRERYVEEGLSIRQIADGLGVSSRAVWTALVRAGVPRRR